MVTAVSWCIVGPCETRCCDVYCVYVFSVSEGSIALVWWRHNLLHKNFFWGNGVTCMRLTVPTNIYTIFIGEIQWYFKKLYLYKWNSSKFRFTLFQSPSFQNHSWPSLTSTSLLPHLLQQELFNILLQIPVSPPWSHFLVAALPRACLKSSPHYIIPVTVKKNLSIDSLRTIHRESSLTYNPLLLLGLLHIRLMHLYIFADHFIQSVIQDEGLTIKLQKGTFERRPGVREVGWEHTTRDNCKRWREVQEIIRTGGVLWRAGMKIGRNITHFLWFQSRWTQVRHNPSPEPIQHSDSTTCSTLTDLSFLWLINLVTEGLQITLVHVNGPSPRPAVTRRPLLVQAAFILTCNLNTFNTSHWFS